MPKLRMLEVWKNANGNGFHHVGSADSMKVAKKLMSTLTDERQLQEIGHNEYYDQPTETIYKIKG